MPRKAMAHKNKSYYTATLFDLHSYNLITYLHRVGTVLSWGSATTQKVEIVRV